MLSRTTSSVPPGAGSHPSAAELTAQLQDPLPSVRVRAAQQLAHCPEPEAVDGLVAALHDPRFGVHWAAGEALATRGARGAIAVLRALMHDAPAVGFLHGAAYALSHVHLTPDQRA